MWSPVASVNLTWLLSQRRLKIWWKKNLMKLFGQLNFFRGQNLNEEFVWCFSSGSHLNKLSNFLSNTQKVVPLTRVLNQSIFDTFWPLFLTILMWNNVISPLNGMPFYSTITSKIFLVSVDAAMSSKAFVRTRVPII